jgi:hypothetical protein
LQRLVYQPVRPRCFALLASASKEWRMLPVGQTAPEFAAAAKLIIVIAVAIVAFWKVVLRLVLAIIAIALIVLLGVGAVVVMHM